VREPDIASKSRKWKQRQVDEGLQKRKGGDINRNNDRHMADMVNWEDILGIRTIDNCRNR
jgi:hypothetical protein